jgi:hypothetical protein
MIIPDAVNRMSHELKSVTVSCEIEPTVIVTGSDASIRVNMS